MSHLTFIGQLHEKLNENDIEPTDWEIRSLDAVSSTNDEVKKLLNFYQKIVILSKIQTRGKGREGRVWYSPEGGIWLSIGIRDRFKIVELSTPIVYRLKKSLLSIVETTIKEPNDLMIDGKKVAGVLVEGEIKRDILENVVVGLGLNVFNDVPEQISDSATKLSEHCSPPPLVELAANLAVEIIQLLENYRISS